MGNVLLVRNLNIEFDAPEGRIEAVRGVSFRVPASKTVALVGESGAGKSVVSQAILGILPKAGRISSGEIIFFDPDKPQTFTDIVRLKPDSRAMRRIRGRHISIIFQEPMTALNPVQRVGKQIIETLLLHKDVSDREALQRAVQLLDAVGIPSPDRRISDHPHQLSGGMRQRVMIAIALCCDPDLLIADEPTTALDVTVQAQILDLMANMQKERGMATLLITHDLGVIAEQCDEVVVMYAGRIVERAPVKELFASPKHAYTKGLLTSIPRLTNERKTELQTIPGQVASIQEFASGCRFCQRMERTGETLNNRPAYKEVEPGRFLETCPACT